MNKIATAIVVTAMLAGQASAQAVNSPGNVSGGATGAAGGPGNTGDAPGPTGGTGGPQNQSNADMHNPNANEKTNCSPQQQKKTDAQATPEGGSGPTC